MFEERHRRFKPGFSAEKGFGGMNSVLDSVGRIPQAFVFMPCVS